MFSGIGIWVLIVNNVLTGESLTMNIQTNTYEECMVVKDFIEYHEPAAVAWCKLEEGRV